MLKVRSDNAMAVIGGEKVMVIFTRSMILKIRVEEKVIVIPSDIDIGKLRENDYNSDSNSVSNSDCDVHSDIKFNTGLR